MIVRFENKQSKFPVTPWKRLLKSVLPAALSAAAAGRQFERLGIEPAITVIFAGPRVMRRINAETRQVDQLTDILSFPMLDMRDGRLIQSLGAEDFDHENPSRQTLFLGDLVLSLDRAFSQAGQFNHTQTREIAFLAIHGLLHLLGYDHADIVQEKRMQRKQRQILNLLGIRRGDLHE